MTTETAAAAVRDKRIPLMECFGPTIQGEGRVIGQQTYFLRFGLCDYKCTMCDSIHAVDPLSVRQYAKMRTEMEIFQDFVAYRESKGGANTTNWITFTGGNPLIHNLDWLVNLLRAADYKINVETQGTLFKKWLEKVNILTISPKGPGMGEKTDLEVLDKFVDEATRIEAELCMKVVVFDQRDLEFAALLRERYHGIIFDDEFTLSLGNPFLPGFDPPYPGFSHRDALIKQYKLLWEDIQRDKRLCNVTFLPQWHTFVWGNAQGH